LDLARQEFIEDIAIEPGVAYNYDQLGALAARQQDSAEAKRYFEKAVQRDPRLAASWFGLAKIHNQEKRYTAALRDLDAAGAADPKSPSVHYLRSRVLTKLGHADQAKAELEAVRRLQHETLSRIEEEISGKYHDPQPIADQ